jgi:lipoprotein-releasing system permease protein
VNRIGWILFIARRFMRSRRRSRSSVTALLAAFGLAMGVLTLVTVISVMNGFQMNTIEDLIEINSFHLRLRGAVPADVLPRLAELNGVELAVEIIETQALVEGYFSGSQAMLIKALSPEMYEPGSDYARRLGLDDLSGVGPGQIILGRELARFLGVQRGDYISVLGLGGENIDLREPVNIELEVVALFSSGYYEFDRGWGFVSLETAASELQAGYRREIAIKIDDRDRDIAAIRRIRQSLDLPEGAVLESWREYNRSIFGALRVEKAMMAFLVGLIFLVVGVNIFQGLRRSVHEHLEDIAVIKVIGGSDADVRRVFVAEGVLIGLFGTGIGLILGMFVAGNINGIFSSVEFLVNFLQRNADFRIFSPSYFYLEEVPSRIIPSEVVLIATVSFLSALLSAWAASKRISTLKPREVLNDE